MERVYVIRNVRPNKILRPFLISSGVKNQEYSLRLERVLVDFGADISYAGAVRK